MGVNLSYGLVSKSVLLAPDEAGLGTVNAFSLSLVSSLAVGCITIVGLVAGYLNDRFGPRPIVLVGTIMCGVGPVVASFANQVWQLYLSFSLFFGAGSALALMPATAAASQWFTARRRNLALSLGVSGSGFGGLLFSWITQALLNAGGWRYTFRINGAISAGLLLIAWALVKESPAETNNTTGASAPLVVRTDSNASEEASSATCGAEATSPASPETAAGELPETSSGTEVDLEASRKLDKGAENSVEMQRQPPANRPRVPGWLLRNFSPFFIAVIYSLTCTVTFVYVFIGSFTLFVPQTFVALAVSDACPTCSNSVGAAIVAMMAGLLAAGRIFVGVLATFIGMQNSLVVSQVMCCIAMLGVWLPYANHPGTLVPLWVMGAIWGLFSGGIVVSVPSTAAGEIANVKAKAEIIAEMKREELARMGKSDDSKQRVAGVATLLGWLYLAYGMGDLTGPAIGGAILDLSTTFDPQTGARVDADWRGVIMYVSVTYLVSTALVIALRFYTSRKVFVRI